MNLTYSFSITYTRRRIEIPGARFIAGNCAREGESSFHSLFHSECGRKFLPAGTPRSPQVKENRSFLKSYPIVTWPEILQMTQMARGPRKSRMGSRKRALSSPRTP